MAIVSLEGDGKKQVVEEKPTTAGTATGTTAISTGLSTPNYSSQLASQLQSVQSQYQAQLEAQQRAQEQAAQNAYNNNLSALMQAYQNRVDGLSSNYDSTRNQLGESYQNSANNLNQSSADALRQAYVNNMLSQRSLRNQLNTQGINGGASESAIASLLNNYGSNRNNINTTTQNNLSSLEQTYNSNLASALQAYNDARAEAENANLQYRMQMENDLANNVVGSYGDLYSGMSNMGSTYANALTSLLTNQANNAADLQATAYQQMLKNTVSPTTTISGGSTTASSGTTSTGYARAQQLRNAGYSIENAATILAEEGYTADQIAQYFTQAGFAL